MLVKFSILMFAFFMLIVSFFMLMLSFHALNNLFFKNTIFQNFH